MNELTYNEFKILVEAEKNKEKLSQRKISSNTNISLGTINKLLPQLIEKNLINHNNLITKEGLDALKPYKVKRAIFLAAGFGSRMVPITLNTPKPLVRVHGKRIIETLLDAVKENEIEEIIIVRGYLKEQFNELLDKYPNIKFIDNDIYNETNNISSAYAARNYLENAYVLESDLVLYNKDLIQKYEYSSNYLGKYVDKTDDWCFDFKKGKIMNLRQGGINCYHLYGISYYNQKDGKKLKEDIEKIFEKQPGGKDQYWDKVSLEFCKDDFNLMVKECHENDIIEIDSFNELKQIDKTYDI